MSSSLSPGFSSSDVKSEMPAEVKVRSDSTPSIPDEVSNSQQNVEQPGSTTEQLQFTYEVDNGKCELDKWNPMFPMYAGHKRGVLSHRRRRGEPTPSRHVLVDLSDKKKLAIRATALFFGFHDRQGGVRAPRNVRSRSRPMSTGVVGGHRQKAVEQYNVVTGETIQVFTFACLVYF